MTNQPNNTILNATIMLPLVAICPAMHLHHLGDDRLVTLYLPGYSSLN